VRVIWGPAVRGKPAGEMRFRGESRAPVWNGRAVYARRLPPQGVPLDTEELRVRSRWGRDPGSPFALSPRHGLLLPGTKPNS
jgi:hypothetical protein